MTTDQPTDKPLPILTRAEVELIRSAETTADYYRYALNTILQAVKLLEKAQRLISLHEYDHEADLHEINEIDSFVSKFHRARAGNR